MELIWITLILSVVFAVSPSPAAEIPIQARVFIGASNGNPSNVNTELKALGLDELGGIPMYGAEISYSVLPALELGINYVKKQNVRKTPSASGADYKSEFNQDVFLAIARVPVVKTSIFRVDAFAGAGGSNTTLKINSATQSGEITRKDDKEFVASFATRYGASVGAGYKGIYLFVEGGYESNKADSLKRTGTLSGKIDSIDMSGPYGFIGLHFNAPEITKK